VWLSVVETVSALAAASSPTRQRSGQWQPADRQGITAKLNLKIGDKLEFKLGRK
jgi:predicted lysophospholipase L1 biosynthesis ABC-type transport system permease subunit